MNRWLETDTQKTARSIINVLNESAAGMVKKEINKDKPEEAPKEKKVALEKRVTKAAIKGKKPESKNAKMPEKTAKKIVKEELEPEAEKSIEDRIADLQDYLNNTPEIAEDEKEAIQVEIDDLISQLGEKDLELNESIDIDKYVNKDKEFRYKLLSRLQSDCDYFLGAGNRVEKHLWANSVEDQIALMKALYNSFSAEDKPEWITLDKIEEYEKEMKGDTLEEANLKLPSEEHPEETKKFINDYQDKKYYQLTKIGLEENKEIKTETTAEKPAKNIAGAMAKKESLEQNEEDGWGEDVLEICEPFFEKVERTMYEVRNARRGSYAHFGDTVSDLAAWMGELSTEAEDVQSELDDMKEQLQESDNEPKTVKEYRIMDGNKVLKTFSADEYDKGYAEMRAMGKALKDAGKEDNLIYKEFTVKNKLKEEYSEKFGGDPKDFIGDLISVKHQLSKLNLDSFGSHLARQMVEDFIETCDRQIEKAKRLASGDEFYTEDNYLSRTRKEEPLDLVAYKPEITSIDEVKDKYVKIRGDFHKVIDVKPEGDKFVISFAAGTGTAIGGEFEPATLDEIKRLQLYTENK